MKEPNLEDLKRRAKSFSDPFDHVIIDDFFPKEVAKNISGEFFPLDDSRWYSYNSPLENKRTIQEWGKLPKHSYSTFQYFCSDKFVNFIKDVTGLESLYPDYGLHGGGWHMHGTGGNLNVHKDYSIHPKLGLQRKINLIVFMSENWEESWGGELELWSNNKKNNSPLKLEKAVSPLFNRAVLFDTTQDSWHGLPKALTCPEGVYRKTLAIYYLTDQDPNADSRLRALFAPRAEQKNNRKILDLIKTRSK